MVILNVMVTIWSNFSHIHTPFKKTWVIVFSGHQSVQVCPNQEGVFQPQTGTATDLGSVANWKFYYNPPAPPVSNVFMDLLFPLYPNAPPSVAFVAILPISCTRYPPTLPAQNATHLDVVRTRHPPASAACLCALRYVPESSNVYHECVTPPPPATLGLLPGTC